jgi:hypothetical protein
MASCLRILAEQVLYMLKGGDPSTGASVELADIKTYIAQLVNGKIKAAYYGEVMAAGDRTPHACVIATYEGLEVESYKEFSRVTLPVTPVALPKNMGLWAVRGTDDPLGIAQFIPIPAGQFTMYKKEPLLSDILAQIGYEQKGRHLIFVKDIKASSPAINAVDVEMVVYDTTAQDEYAPLPIPADMEPQLVQEAFQFFSNQRPPDKLVDTVADNQNKA